jgi:hypothetical protein
MTVSIALRALRVACVLLLVGGCTEESPPADAAPSRADTVAPSPTSDPARVEVMEALLRTQRAPHRYTVHSGLPGPEGGDVDGAGAVDSAARAVELRTKVTGKTPLAVDRIVIGDDLYTRETGRNTWVHADLDRVKPGAIAFFDRADPTGLGTFISAMWSVRRIAPNVYSGMFDPNHSSGAFLPVGAPSLVSLGMPQAPFTIKTDEQGWVTSLAVELVQGTGTKITMTTELCEHGRQLTIKPPSRSDVVEADDAIYK